MDLPVHCELPVHLTSEGNPSDGLIIVVRINATKGDHAAFRVTTQESEQTNLLTCKETQSFLKKLRCYLKCH